MDTDASILFNQLWRLPPGANHSPAPMPITITRSELPTIRNWLVAPKNDGFRVSLLLGAHELRDRDVPFAALLRFEKGKRQIRVAADTGIVIDQQREIDAPILKTRVVQDDLFNGTLLDGELVEGVFVAFDAVAVCGFDTKSLPFFERVALVRQACEALAPDALKGAGVHRVEPKPWVSTDALEQLVSRVDVEKEGTFDGLIFADPTSPLRTGRANCLVKWKPTRMHTLDFRFKEGRWWYGHHAEEKDLLEEKGVKISNPNDVEIEESRVYECRPIDSDHFAVMALRTDKDAPNNERCVDVTRTNVLEDVTLAEMVETLGRPPTKRVKTS